MKVSTVKKLIKENKLKSFKVGVKHFILREKVHRYINENSCFQFDCYEVRKIGIL